MCVFSICVHDVCGCVCVCACVKIPKIVSLKFFGYFGWAIYIKQMFKSGSYLIISMPFWNECPRTNVPNMS